MESCITPEEYARLLQMQKLMDSFMNLTSDGIAIVDIHGRILDVNKRFEELHGWSKAEIVGTILPMTSEEHKSSILEQYERIKEGEHYSGKESLRLRKDGSTFYASVTISPIKDEHDQVVAFIGVERDITEQKQVEEALRESELQCRRLLKLSPEPIIVHCNGIIQIINDSGKKLLSGICEDDIIGRSIFDFFPPSEHATIKERLSGLIHTDDFIDFKGYQLQRLDGDFLDVEMSSIYVYKHLNNPVIQTVIRDMTERKRTEEYVRMTERLSVVGQLAAGVAHEIRNPLTSLKGFMQLLKAKNTEYVDIMLDEVERINQIATEFMTIAKPYSTHYSEQQLQPLLLNVVQFMKPQAVMFGTQMKLNMDVNTKPVFCDPNQMKQIMLNIIKNAIEAMPLGGLVTISLEQSDTDDVVIRIEDQGAGIPEEQLEKLGEPFYTTKETGTGLGIMVSRQIIEAHQGTMSIQSKLQQGTTVTITLPCYRQTAQAK